MAIAAADEHAIFLDDAEAGCGFAGASEDVVVAGAAEEGEDMCGPKGDESQQSIVGESGKGLWYLVAMPEQRASVLRATRSPNRIFRTGPRTVAQCLTGLNSSASLMCHSTL